MAHFLDAEAAVVHCDEVSGDEETTMDTQEGKNVIIFVVISLL